MNTNKKGLAIFTVLLIFSSCYFAGRSAAAQPNLIANPGFEIEEYTTDGEASYIGIWYSYGLATSDSIKHSGSLAANPLYGSYAIQDFSPGLTVSSLGDFSVYIYFSSQRAAEFFDLIVYYYTIVGEPGFNAVDAIQHQVFFDAPLQTWFKFDIKAFLAEYTNPGDEVRSVRFGQYDSQQFDASYVDDFNLQTTPPRELVDWRIYFTWFVYILIAAGFLVIFGLVARAKMKQGSK